MAESVAGLEDMASRSCLLLRGDASDLHQGETLLKGAITEVENLQNMLLSGVRELAPRPEEGLGSGAMPRRAGTFGGYDSSPTILNKKGSVKKKNYSGGDRDRSQRARSDPQLKEIQTSQALEQPPFFDLVLMLSQRLYSLQAIICQQDSHIELQRASLKERASFPGRHRGNVLLEQEKQRTLALQREELASFHKLQSQHRQEQARWERERERHRQQAEAAEGKLRQREEECRRQEEKLAEEREELERQREMYQQDLERLRESTRTVVPLSGSLNGDLLLGMGGRGVGGSDLSRTLPLPQKALVRPSLSGVPADYLEHPEVPPRGQSVNATVLPVKKEVPLHLCSTTNQQHKQFGVQQQIPTKLAALSSKSSKNCKGKASHRTDSTASVDMKQMLPMKFQTSNPLHTQPQAPNRLHTQSPNPSSAQAPVHGLSHSQPPPYRITEDLNKEDKEGTPLSAAVEHSGQGPKGGL
ncbi:unnamed protein product, partial [Coregonus sp. 'balchen']